MSHVNAKTYTSKATGKWESTETWHETGYPSLATDTVLIDGHSVTLDSTTIALHGVDGKITIAYLKLTNLLDLGPTKLFLNGNSNLVITGDFDAISSDIWRNILIQSTQEASLTINGNCTLVRTEDNEALTYLKITLFDQSTFTVNGNFEYDYKNSGFIGIHDEIYQTGKSIFTVEGETKLTARNGNAFDFYMEGESQANLNDFSINFNGGSDLTVTVAGDASLTTIDSVSIVNNGGSEFGSATLQTGSNGGSITIGGNLFMESTVADRSVEIISTGTDGSISVAGDITLKAKSDSDVKIEMEDDGTLAIGGKFNRPDNYGNLMTSNGGQLIYNGTQQQTIACDSLVGSGTDSFESNNVKFENSSGEPMLLEGKIVVRDSMVLSNGIIKTVEPDDIIVENLALIKGGNSESYIDGPITKEGSTGGEPFIFPLGKNNIYAPIEITPINEVSSIITADYKGDPPPYIDRVEGGMGGIDHISTKEYWTVDRIAGSENINVSLHWTDASARGIDDLNSLVVAQLNSTDSTWYNSGVGTITGDLTIPGSVQTGDPPPYIEAFTFASTSPSTNSLPVEMTRFEVRKDDDNVYLLWETASELNSDYFMVERSENGIDFYPLNKVKSKGTTNELSRYSTIDDSPFYGINYYRLRQVDLDGKESLSEILSARFDINPNISLFPNPVKDQLNILLESKIDGEAKIEIFNQQGQLLYNEMIMLSKGNCQLGTNEVNILESGIYFLMITYEGQRITLEFSKIE